MSSRKRLETDWSQKYRPKTLKECILPSRIKEPLQRMIDRRAIVSLLFHGSFGVGKTTAADAICRETHLDTLFVNASLDNGVDDLRDTVEVFAHTLSFTGHKKVVH